MPYEVMGIGKAARHPTGRDGREVDTPRIESLRDRVPMAVEALLGGCTPGLKLTSRSGDLAVFECCSRWPDPCLPPLDRHLLVVALSPAACVSCLGRDSPSLHQLAPGEVLILPAGEPGHLEFRPPYRLALLALKPSLLYAAGRDRRPRSPVVLRAASGLVDHVIEGLARTLLATAGQGQDTAPVIADALASALAAQLISRHAHAEAPDRHSLGRLRLQRVLDFLDSHLAQPLRLEEAAAVAGCSVHHLSHLFKSETGMSPMRYFNQKRMRLARELVETTRLSMGEIGLRVGCANPARFSQTFRAHWNCAPSALRRHP